MEERTRETAPQISTTLAQTTAAFNRQDFRTNSLVTKATANFRTRTQTTKERTLILISTQRGLQIKTSQTIRLAFSKETSDRATRTSVEKIKTGEIRNNRIRETCKYSKAINRVTRISAAATKEDFRPKEIIILGNRSLSLSRDGTKIQTRVSASKTKIKDLGSKIIRFRRGHRRLRTTKETIMIRITTSKSSRETNIKTLSKVSIKIILGFKITRGTGTTPTTILNQTITRALRTSETAGRQPQGDSPTIIRVRTISLGNSRTKTPHTILLVQDKTLLSTLQCKCG